MRAYTVEEVDNLRGACTSRWLYGSTISFGKWSRPHSEEERDRGVEELVRTAMLAGIIAEDIYEEDRKKHETSNSNCKIS